MTDAAHRLPQSVVVTPMPSTPLAPNSATVLRKVPALAEQEDGAVANGPLSPITIKGSPATLPPPRVKSA